MKMVETESIAVKYIIECVTVELTITNDTFCENIEQLLGGAKSIKTIFVCCDFNIDLLKRESHNSTCLRHNVQFGSLPFNWWAY